MNDKLGAVAAVLLPAVLLCACQVSTDPYGRTVMSTPSLGQMLGVRPGFQGAAVPVAYSAASAPGQAIDQRTVRGHTVQIVQTGPITAHRVLVDGRTVIEDTESTVVAIQGVYEGGGRSYVLVGEASGGTACPSLYRAIDLSGPTPVVSTPFGNCSDVPRVGISGGALRASFPGFRAARPATYTFKDGRLGR